jgi:hypothetical protein
MLDPIGLDAHPTQVSENGISKLLRRPIGVCIIITENEHALVLEPEQPI